MQQGGLEVGRGIEKEMSWRRKVRVAQAPELLVGKLCLGFPAAVRTSPGLWLCRKPGSFIPKSPPEC